MSSAVYPLGMRPVPSSGYNHKSSMSTQYVTWKGTGLSKTPTGVTSGTIRPLTNKDYGNNYPAPFGKARPIKHARKGYVPRIPVADIETDRNLNRDVKSSTNGSLVKQMIDTPGGFSVKENTLSDAAPNCGAVCVSAELYPNLSYLTNNPEPRSESTLFCCNEEKKARRRSRPASTLLSKNYYTRHTEYMENRCQTFDQRAFNFVRSSTGNPDAKPGAPDADNYYVANCYCPGTPSECGKVVYKPNNYQFAQQGAVSSSTLNLKLNQNAINTNLANLPHNIIIYKNKSEPCRPIYYAKNGNATSCPATSKAIALLNADAQPFVPEPGPDPDPPYVPSILTIRSFNDVGSTTWTAPAYVTSVTYLVVSGGGGGGGAYDTGAAGGGGGGLVLTGTHVVTPGTTYTIVVGAGGTGGASTPEGGGGAGGDSSFDIIIAGGGSGGLASRVQTGGAGAGGTIASGTTPPGGGSGAGNAVGGERGGGGGGNTTAGTSGAGDTGAGGLGLANDITGTSVTYGVGGVGGRPNVSSNGAAGTNLLGNGGGGAGARSSDNKSGGAGGSGAVVLRYLV